MPDAAEAPVRNSLGIDQNGPLALNPPATTNARRMIEIRGTLATPRSIKATAAMITGTAVWYFRSNLRSELRETMIIATEAMAYGTITSNPTNVFV